jgi:hypothetical protein
MPILKGELTRAIRESDLDNRAHKAAVEIFLVERILGQSLCGRQNETELFDDELVRQYIEAMHRSPRHVRTFALPIHFYARTRRPSVQSSLAFLHVSLCASEGAEPSFMRRMDIACTLRVLHGRKVSREEQLRAAQVLCKSVLPHQLTTDYLYSFTHIIFYMVDLGWSPLHISEERREKIACNVLRYAEYVNQVGDYDLLAELIICARMLEVPTSKLGLLLRSLLDHQNADGSFDRYNERDPEQTNIATFFKRYHPTLVTVWALARCLPVRNQSKRPKPVVARTRSELNRVLQQLTSKAVKLHMRGKFAKTDLLIDVLAARHLRSRSEISAAINRRKSLGIADVVTVLDILSTYGISLEEIKQKQYIKIIALEIMRSERADPFVKFTICDVLAIDGQRDVKKVSIEAFVKLFVGREIERVRWQVARCKRSPDFNAVRPTVLVLLIVLLSTLDRLFDELRRGEVGHLIESLYIASALYEHVSGVSGYKKGHRLQAGAHIGSTGEGCRSI